MCGFAALFQPERVFSPQLLSVIDQDLHHRGPDSGGVKSHPGMALVFRRLSILDVSHSADQPMTHSSGRYSLVFNGEIYNYREIRSKLEATGMSFRTTGDTEVLLEGFAHWGPSVVDHLEGMYAFVVVDHQERVAYAARDPLGIKPLYMLHYGPLVAFSSTMAPLCRFRQAEPDPQALSELLIFRFAAGKLSNLKGIERVPGGTIVRLNLDDNEYKTNTFCDVLETLKTDKTIDEQSVHDLVDEKVRSSVRDHLASDVGYAVQLSGGIDSSLITLLASEATNTPVHSYGISLGDTIHDERQYREEVTRLVGTSHHEMAVDSEDFADSLPRAISHMEGPSPHLGCILLMRLCDEIRKQTKVVLTGEGADELFGGYQRYELWRNLKKYETFAHMVPGFLWPFLQRYKSLQVYSNRDAAAYSAVLHDYFPLLSIFPELVPTPGSREITASRFSDFRDRMMAVDQTAYLESLLLRQDKMAMAASVEARVPFAHFPLTRRINAVSQDIRVPGGSTKPLLKKFAEKFFPAEFVHRRKVGLTLPLDDWLGNPQGLGRYIPDLLSSNSELSRFGEIRDVRALVSEYQAGNSKHARVITHLINVELWLQSIKLMPQPVVQ